MATVTFVKIYTTEEEHILKPIMTYLHQEAKVRGTTVLRAIEGFGKTSGFHLSSLIDLSLNLPLIIEFFDEPTKMQEVISKLQTMIKPGHMIVWQAECH